MKFAPSQSATTTNEAFERILLIMDQLRENCPWDKKQTIETLRYLTIEETFELSDAILDQDWESIEGELGDLLLHLVFYTRIATEEKRFDLVSMINKICDKLIRRHPHIYADTDVSSKEEVQANWEQIKLKEKGNTSVLGGVPKSLPPMIKAMRIQEKVRGVGFDWDEKSQVWEKVEEEMQEFKAEFNIETGEIDKEKAQAEFGDILFSLINYARFLEINPDEALERTNKKFIKRFQYLETESARDGKQLGEMSLAEMDLYWESAKKF